MKTLNMREVILEIILEIAETTQKALGDAFDGLVKGGK